MLYGTMGEEILIGSLNVRGLADVNKRRSVFNFIRENKIDIMFMQETHSSEKSVFMWESEVGGRIISSHGETNARGVIILISKRLQRKIKIDKTTKDTEGRWIITDITVDSKSYTLVNVYGPNEDDPEYFKKIIYELRNHECTNIVMGGDFNMVMDSDIDSVNRNPSHQRAREVLLQLCEEFDMIDCWRTLNPQKKLYTWQRMINKKEGKK